MAFELPPLPYPKDALAPHMSEQTLDFHHGKHHATYVTNLNGLVEGTERAGQVAGGDHPRGRPRAAVQQLGPGVEPHVLLELHDARRGRRPRRRPETAIESAFGSVDGFKQTFTDKAKTLFGSGWTWLVTSDGGLDIVQTKDADLPLKHGKTALLTLDVWEHAYYLDYQNARPAYIETWLGNLVNWEFAAENLAKA